MGFSTFHALGSLNLIAQYSLLIVEFSPKSLQSCITPNLSTIRDKRRRDSSSCSTPPRKENRQPKGNNQTKEDRAYQIDIVTSPASRNVTGICTTILIQPMRMLTGNEKRINPSLY